MTSFIAANSGQPSIPVVLVTEAGIADWIERSSAVARRWAETQNFRGRRDELLLVPGADGSLAEVAFGLGQDLQEDGNPWPFAKLAASIPAGDYRIDADLTPGQAYHAALGWALQQYSFTRYKADNSKSEKRVLIAPNDIDIDDLTRVIEATFLVRDLVNTPTSDLGPADLGVAAQQVAARHGATVQEIVGNDLIVKNFPAIHAVGRASSRPPRLIDITWRAANTPANARKITLVGKGVCFDTGGLDLKPSSAMRLMKKDMGGAAHALALGTMIMAARLPVELRVLIPAVENSVGGDAFRPGDVLQTRKGLTVEVDNTDAEGRLILADALALADADKPDLLIDFATLTGAARVALGPDIPPFFTPNDGLAAALDSHARVEADPVWRLPLWMPYMDDLKSPIADLANSSASGFAGAITAALFLKRFVTETPNWIHLDVFAWNKSSRAGRPQGGEAMSLRAVYRLIEDYAKT